jgi:hypothetical protein
MVILHDLTLDPVESGRPRFGLAISCDHRDQKCRVRRPDVVGGALFAAGVFEFKYSGRTDYPQKSVLYQYLARHELE